MAQSRQPRPGKAAAKNKKANVAGFQDDTLSGPAEKQLARLLSKGSRTHRGRKLPTLTKKDLLGG